MKKHDGIPFKAERVWEAKYGHREVYILKGNIFRGGSLYWPWSGGCGIGQGLKTLKEAQVYVRSYTLAEMKRNKKEMLENLGALELALSKLEKEIAEEV